MILGSGVDNCLRFVSWYQLIRSDEESFFGIATIRGLVFVSSGPIIEAFNPRTRHRHHRKIRVADSGPVNRTIQHQVIRTVLVCIDSRRRVTLEFVIDVGDGFRRDRVKRVAIDALIANAWSNRELYGRDSLTAALYRNRQSCL